VVFFFLCVFRLIRIFFRFGMIRIRWRSMRNAHAWADHGMLVIEDSLVVG